MPPPATANETMESDDRQARVAARRLRFREAVTHLSGRAQSVELLKLLVVPGAVFLVGGFGTMFLGWYGAARTHRTVEQIPYLISGGLVGLGLVLVGALLLASAFWMTQLHRFADRAEQRAQRDLATLEERLRSELGEPVRPVRRKARPGDGASDGTRERRRSTARHVSH